MPSIAPSKTQRLYLVLRDQIVSGALRPGERLPSEPVLAERHKLSRVTIRRALEGLERDGLIDRVPGAGTFVRDAAGKKGMVADLSNMLTQLVAMGRTTGVRLLEFGYCTAPAPVGAALLLPTAARVQRSVRVRIIDGAPFSFLTTYVPEAVGVTYSEKDLASTPLLSLLERSGVAVERANQTISATLATPDIAEHLDVAIGSALIAMTRVVYDTAGKGVEYLQAFYRPDLHTFQMELRRTSAGASRQWAPQPPEPAVVRRPSARRARR
ncbi:MAG: GntR family transcriptional regulator [Beijerinckiaceae bacterium]